MKPSFLLLSKLFVLLLTFSSCAQPKAPQEKDMAAYMLVYFTDPTHSLFMALSTDGYTFTDINNGKPVIAGDTIASQKGIRDPHI